MKIIVNDKELKEYFDGLANLLLRRNPVQPPAAESIDASKLAVELRQTIREELGLIALAAQQDGAAGLNKLGRVFEPYEGKPAELLTPAGTVEGTILKIGGDYLVVREAGGTSVMVPLEQLISFQLSGKQVDQ